MDWPSQYCWLSVQMPFSNSSIYLLLRLQNKKKLDSHINWRNIERFSHDLEWKRANKTETTNRAIWLVYRTDTKARGFWLFKRTLEWKNVIPENFLEINRYFALTSYCNTIGQLNNAFSILGFFGAKRRVHVLFFSSLDDKTNNEHFPKPFFKIIRKSL